MSIDENNFYLEFETYVKQELLQYYTTSVYPNLCKKIVDDNFINSNKSYSM